MKAMIRTAATSLVLALAATPALAQQPEGTPTATNNPGTSYQEGAQPAGTPDQTSNPGTQAQEENRPASTPTAEDNPGTARRVAAPGQYCKEASKKPVEGEKGSAFSQCVKGQARLRSGKADSPREACRAASKKRVKGQRGTPFALCVKAAAQLQRDRAERKANQEQEAPAPA